jgi:hypothetical protein
MTTLDNAYHRDGRYLEPPVLLRLRSGEDFNLEQEAAALLAESRQGITALSEKRDWLTDDQLRLRYQREVPNQNGVCDESLFSGMFKRAFNADAGKRPTGRPHSHDD